MECWRWNEEEGKEKKRKGSTLIYSYFIGIPGPVVAINRSAVVEGWVPKEWW